MPFQSANIQYQQAPGVSGDFASTNPFSSVPAPDGGFVADVTGVTVGLFAWQDPTDTTGREVMNSSLVSIAPRGFVVRANNALITTYLAESSLVIPAGKEVTLIMKGDLFCTVTVATASVGQKAFAKLTDGTMQPGAAGATIVGYVETPFTIQVGGAVGELAVISN